MLKEFQGKGRLIRAFYYTALVEDQEYSSIRPLIDWLDYNGYAVVTKPTKEFVDALGRRKIKGNMDIELAVDAMEMAEHHRPHGAVLRRRRLPLAGRGRAAQGRARFGRLDRARRSRRWWPTNCAARPTSSSISPIWSPRSAATRDRPERRRTRVCRPPRRAMRCTAPAAPTTRTVDSTAAAERPANPRRDCPLCPRLVAFRRGSAAAQPDWHNAPVPPSAADARLLIVGLAPGLQGANRTGRPFTGDWAGDLLYETLAASAFAAGTYDERPDDGLTLVDCAITNAVRCVPPENKPTPAGDRDLPRLSDASAWPRCRSSAAVVALGRIAHESVLRALRRCASRPCPFGHGREHRPARAPGAPIAPLRQLSLLALQHEHRRADAADVPRGVRRRCGATSTMR